MEARPKPRLRPSPADELLSCCGWHPTRQQGQRPAPAWAAGVKCPQETPACAAAPHPRLTATATEKVASKPSAGRWELPVPAELPGVPAGICKGSSGTTKLLLFRAGAPNQPEHHQRAAPSLGTGKAQASTGGCPRGHSSSLPGDLRFGKGPQQAPGAWHLSSNIIATSIRSHQARGEW